MHKRTEKFIERERYRADGSENSFLGLDGEDYIKGRYLEKYNCCAYEPEERLSITEENNGEWELANEIIEMMKNHKMVLVDACVMLGYIRRLLKIDDVYRSGIDIEEIYINKCLRKELIRLAKEIADYIQNQEEIYANIPKTLNFVYRALNFEASNINLW